MNQYTLFTELSKDGATHYFRTPVAAENEEKALEQAPTDFADGFIKARVIVYESWGKAHNYVGNDLETMPK
jgi:hypothetical protein